MLCINPVALQRKRVQPFNPNCSAEHIQDFEKSGVAVIAFHRILLCPALLPARNLNCQFVTPPGFNTEKPERLHCHIDIGPAFNRRQQFDSAVPQKIRQCKQHPAHELTGNPARNLIAAGPKIPLYKKAVPAPFEEKSFFSGKVFIHGKRAFKQALRSGKAYSSSECQCDRNQETQR